jgi:hypothetical protein
MLTVTFIHFSLSLRRLDVLSSCSSSSIESSNASIFPNIRVGPPPIKGFYNLYYKVLPPGFKLQ